MAAEIANVFHPDLREKVIGAKLLVVGAGGIGCEVLKNLVMSGFKDIEIVRECEIASSWNSTLIFPLFFSI